VGRKLWWGWRAGQKTRGGAGRTHALQELGSLESCSVCMPSAVCYTFRI
jgi:hypothetical protein